MPGRETAGGVYDIVLDVQDKVTTILAGGNVPQTFGVTEAPLDSPCLYGIAINDVDGTLIPSANITPGTYKIEKVRAGVRSTVAEGVAMSKSDGRVYFEYTFLPATWTLSDIFEISFAGVIITNSGNTSDISANNIIGRITELPNINAEIEAANIKLDAISTILGSIGDVPISTKVELTEAYLGRQLLTDPDMELGTAGAWTATTGAAVTRSASYPVRRGMSSMRVIATDAGSGVSSNALTGLTVGTHLAGAWVYHEAGSPRTFNLGAFHPGQPLNFFFISSDVLVPSGQWTCVSGTFGETVSAEFVIRLTVEEAGTTFYVDSASVSRISAEEIYTLLDAIKAKTTNLPASPAAVGSAMTLTAGTVSDIQSGRATSAALATTDGKVDAVKTLAEGASGFAAVKGDTAAVRTLAEGANGLAAIKSAVATVDTQTDILADGTNGNAAIKTELVSVHDRLKRFERGLGENLITNPGFDVDNGGWSLSNASGSAAYARDTSVKRQGTASLRVDGYSTDGASFGITTRRSPYSRFYASAWVYCTEAGVPIKLGLTNGAANITGVTVANGWVRLEGVLAHASTATAGSSIAFLVAFNAASAPSKSIYIDDVSLVYLDESVTDYNARRTLHKDTSLTYDPATDSQEAIRDRLDAVNTALADKVSQQKAVRSGAASLSVSSITALFSLERTVPWEFKGGWIDLSSLGTDVTATVTLSVKLKSGGLWRVASTVVLTGTGDAKPFFVPQQMPIGGTSYQAIIPSFWNAYGVKVELTCSSSTTIDHEWYYSE